MVAPILTAVDHVFDAIPNPAIDAAVTAIFPPIADILPAVPSVLAPVPNVFPAVSPVLTPIPNVLAILDAVLARNGCRESA